MHPQAPKQFLRPRIVFHVDPVVGQSVANREVTQPVGVGRVTRADDPKAGPQADQDRPTHDERPQDQVSQHLVARHDFAQPVGRDDQHLSRLHHDSGHEYRLSGDETKLAEETTRTVDADHALFTTGLLNDRDLALQDDEEVAVAVTFAIEDIARLHGATLSRARKSRDLIVAEPGVCPVEIRGLRERQGVGQHVHVNDLSRDIP